MHFYFLIFFVVGFKGIMSFVCLEKLAAKQHAGWSKISAGRVVQVGAECLFRYLRGASALI